MKTSSAKAKARRLQNAVRNMIQDYLVGVCEAGDVRCAIMGESGPDIVLSPLAQKHFPFHGIECKAQEKISIWTALKQAEAHGEYPLLFFTRNRSEIYVALRADHFFEVI